MKLSDFNPAESICILTFSNPGIGSTFMLGSVPGRAVMFSSGNGLQTMRSALFKKKFPTFNPELEIISGLEDPRKVSLVKQYIDRVNYWFQKERRDTWDVMIFDDLDDFRSAAMWEAARINDEDGKSQALSKVASRNGLLLPGIQDFGVEMGVVDGFLRHLTMTARLYGKHIIINAHVKKTMKKDPTSKDKNAKVLDKIVPLFTGQANEEGPGQYFDLIIYITREGIAPSLKLHMQFHPGGDVAAKDRYSVFKYREENITYQQMFDRIKAGIPVDVIAE